MMYFTQEQYDRMRMTEQQAKEIEKLYLNNNMKVLKSIIEKLVEKKGVVDSCKDDLRSLGQLVFFQSMFTYNPEREASFNTYLIGNIWRKFKTYGRDKTRKSRCNWEQVWDDENRCYKRDENGNIVKKPVFDISMYSKKTSSRSNNSGDGREIWESFEYKKDFVNELIERENSKEDEFSKEMKEYLESLSSIQVRILKLVANGFEKEEIVSTLCISKELYSDSIRAIKDIKRIRLLTRKDGR